MDRDVLHGILIVDKPSGMTSHDVVGRVRRGLGMRRVGHAGTLDPMATGVLVVALGEATKLTQFLTADSKSYQAELRLGVATHTLDADGEVVDRADVPDLALADVRQVARQFLGRQNQRAPAVSAIKVGGVALHERVRRGEEVEAPERDVVVHRLEITAYEKRVVSLEVNASKGFYVRSLGRDLAIALGTVGHLTRLRRIASGGFSLDHAVVLDDVMEFSRNVQARARVESAMLSLEQAVAGMHTVRLDEDGARDVRHGRPVPVVRCVAWPSAVVADEPLALLDSDSALIAIGRREGERIRVIRGIVRQAGG